VSESCSSRETSPKRWNAVSTVVDACSGNPAAMRLQVRFPPRSPFIIKDLVGYTTRAGHTPGHTFFRSSVSSNEPNTNNAGGLDTAAPRCERNTEWLSP
jgi:hypothetical protein